MKKEIIRILLIEDNQNDIELIKKALKKVDGNDKISLTVARDGEEGLLKLEELNGNIENEKLIDLIMCDINMPRMNGVEFLSRIKNYESKHRRIPIVMFTTSSNHRDIKQSYDQFCNSYITKPLSYFELIEVLTRLINYWLDNQYSQ